MIDSSQQQPNPRNSAGYRPLVPQEFSKGLGNSPTAYVAAAVGLGLVIGVTMGLAGGHSNAAAPRVSDALSTHSSGASPIPAVYAATTPSLLSQVDTKKTAVTDSPTLLQASDNSTRKSAGGHKKHRLHRLWHWKKGGKNGAHRKPYVSPTPVAEPDPPTGLELATAAAAAGPFFLGIEGDVTVANYDAGTGAIQTYEGSNFLLAKAAEPSAIPWQDFPFNVHYRCDESGNCTLVHRGATASARLTR
ncbi:MAG: hypothetical protein ABR987_07435 [Terracidiphilus sp.]|jgi:hypothetical protein